MKIPTIQAYDDLDRVEKQQDRNPADHIRHISVDGTWFELDLTGEHATEFDRVVLRYVNAGVKMSGPPKKAGKTPSGRKSVAHGGRRAASYYAGLVAWVDAEHITKKDGSGRPAYEGRTDDKRDYPDWLLTDYDAHLEQTSADPAA